MFSVHGEFKKRTVFIQFYTKKSGNFLHTLKNIYI